MIFDGLSIGGVIFFLSSLVVVWSVGPGHVAAYRVGKFSVSLVTAVCQRLSLLFHTESAFIPH